MGKKLKIIFGGLLICILGIMISGCGASEKFEGKWVAEINNGTSVLPPRAAGFEIQKNGDKDYFIDCYYVYMNADGELEEDKDPSNRFVAKKSEDGNTLIIPNGMGGTVGIPQVMGGTITYNEKTKCLESNFVPYGHEYKKLKNGEYDQEFKSSFKEVFDPWYQKQKEWHDWLDKRNKERWR
ncbi:hypothetical protein [Anaerovibrio sp. RM50]|uniref:hypothetical protein n=1 Tax=Anaerovibrio sp. RM50 TaxID=1200557 RepID=UPI0004806BEE|nr:hypothetical protein [Anaerovibrio sp. RM50]